MGSSANEVVAGVGNSTDTVLDIVSPTNHINLILSAAEAVKYVRPDSTYTTERWCTPAGAGTKAGTSLANAYGLTELNTALASTSNLHVYMVGTFEPTAYNSTGPLITVVADNNRLDFATYQAKCRGYSGLTWTASGTNGEYWATVGGNQRNFRITEDGVRMQGVCPVDCGAAMPITAIDTTNDTVTLSVYRELQVNDVIAMASTADYGISIGTTYYVKTATALSGGSQTISLSTTIGGATLDITGTVGTTRYMFSLVGGRENDPVPGSLEAGQFAWAPHEARIYIKPSSGTPSDHTYTFWQTGTSNFITIADAAGSCNNTEIVGGEFYGAAQYGIFIGHSSAQGYATNTKIYGTIVHSCESGIVNSGATDSDISYNVVYDCSDHAIGSKNGTNNEEGQLIKYNWVYDLARQPWDSGDCQAVVTNPSSNDTIFLGNVLQRIGHRRDLTTYPIGENDTINTGAAVIDSSSKVWIINNYFDECHGECVEFGPNDVQAITYAKISGNVFDQRNLPAEIPDFNYKATVPTSISVGISSSATAGYGSGYDNVIDGNLFIMGDCVYPGEVTFNHAAMCVVRNAKTGAATDSKITARNNVVILTNATAPWNIMAVRYTGTSAAATGIDSDYNYYYSASPNALGVEIMNSTNAGVAPSSTVTVAALGTGSGWTSPDGTVSDKHSTVWSATDFSDNFSTNPTVLKCLSC